MRVAFRVGVLVLVAVAACAELRESEEPAATADGGGTPADEDASLEDDASASADARADRTGKDVTTTDGPTGGDGGTDAKVRVPQVLVSGVTYPFEIVRDGDTLYYTLDGDQTAEVRKVLIDGGASAIVADYDAASGVNAIANDLVVAGSEVLWANATAAAGGIYSIAKSGGPRHRVGGLLDSPYHFTTFGSDLYFVDQAFSPFTYAVQRMGPDGGGRTNVAEYQIRVGGIAVDGTGVYWTHGGPLANGKNGVRRRANGADAAADLHVGNDNGDVGGLALTANDVVWADADGGRILKVSKSGGLVSVLADQLAYPLRVIIDGAYVYFTEYGLTSAADGNVKRVPLAGGVVEPIATGQDHPVGIALDTTYVYWTNRGGGEVVRVEK